MKKILLCLFGILLFTGCSCTNTTMVSSPTKKVEEFLGKYQNMDTEVLTQLDLIVSEDTTMSDEEKSRCGKWIDKHRAKHNGKYSNCYNYIFI